MRSLYLLSSSLVLLCTVVRGQNDFINTHNVTSAIEAVPPCGQACLVPELANLPCNGTSFVDIAQCLCYNVPIQEKVSDCVMKNCTFADQALTATVNQGLCQGFHIESRSHLILKTVVIVSAMAFPFVFLRIWSRLSIAKGLGMDDWAMLVAAGGVVAIMILEIEMAIGGWGNHIWTLDVTRLPTILKLFFATEILYILVQCFTKVSILLFYLRIFPQRWFVNSTIATICFVVFSDVAFIFVIAFQCSPVSSVWNKSITGHCLNLEAIIYSGAGCSILEHVVIILLPIPCIQSLKVGKGKRISLFVMFSIGTFALAAALIRLKYISNFGASTDSTWVNGNVEIWSAIELAVALICACLPALRPLLTRYVPILFGSGGNSGQTYESRYGAGTGTWGERKGVQDSTRRNTYPPPVSTGEKSEREGDGESSIMGFATAAGETGSGSGGFERRYRLEHGSLREVTPEPGHRVTGSVGTFTPGRWSEHSSQGSDVELVIMKPESSSHGSQSKNEAIGQAQ